jgi:undecaprenyl phosphate N,N'-diacetylbacillosamine 1-phosphate transferase
VYKYIKHTLDFLLSLIGFILISPIFLFLWLLLAIVNEGAGAFFTQERPGIREKIFKLYKFKSMTDEVDAEGKLLPDAQRLTKIGRFIRKTSLDELPQLWNMLIGDMSLVRPRPCLFNQTELLEECGKRGVYYHLPGITSLIQINEIDYIHPVLLAKTDAEMPKDLPYKNTSTTSSPQFSAKYRGNRVKE